LNTRDKVQRRLNPDNGRKEARQAGATRKRNKPQRPILELRIIDELEMKAMQRQSPKP
jgi:hypothetical protein